MPYHVRPTCFSYRHTSRSKTPSAVSTALISAGAAPSAFLVESCCQVVADHAGEPSRRHAAIGDARLGVGEQRSRDASAARLARDEKLIELVILDHAEP